MTRFFRLIRQKLLSQNKFSKYLVYAVGEIFLVVIGILIALQINNWNEHKKARAFEIFTLKEVRNNLINDSIQIHDILTKRLIVDQTLQNLSTADLSSISAEQLAKDVAILWDFDRFFPNRNGYEALKSRGFQISNPELRSALGKYYENDLVKVSASIYDLEIAFEKKFTPLIQKGYFGIRNKAQPLQIMKLGDPDFQTDLIAYVTVLSPNHRGSTKTVQEFSEINRRLLNSVHTSLHHLTK